MQSLLQAKSAVSSVAKHWSVIQVPQITCQTLFKHLAQHWSVILGASNNLSNIASTLVCHWVCLKHLVSFPIKSWLGFNKNKTFILNIQSTKGKPRSTKIDKLLKIHYRFSPIVRLYLTMKNMKIANVNLFRKFLMCFPCVFLGPIKIKSSG